MAIARHGGASAPNIKVKEKDLFDLAFDDLKDFDVIVDAFGAWSPETVSLHQTSLKHLSDILSGKPNRLLVVGGAGSLYTNPEHTQHLMDSPDFSDSFMPVNNHMGAALEALRKRDDVN